MLEEKKLRLRESPISWMNSNIAELMKARDLYYRKVTFKISYHWDMYRNLGNFVRREIDKAKSYYCTSLITDANSIRVNYENHLNK